MRYSIINPRTPRPVARACAELRETIQTGTDVDVDRASERLRAAEKVASARRASLHAVKIVRRTLQGVAPKWDAGWECFVHQVEGFRK